MFRITLALSLLFLANTAQTVQTIAKAQEQRTQAELPTLTHCEALIKSVTPAIVQFSYDDSGSGRQSHFGCGVIVSNDGHVAVSGPVRAVLDDKLLELRFADGRKVAGKALGWSSEFGFGMLKITEPGEWPSVKLSKQVDVGQVCLALGYPRDYKGEENRPDFRLDVVTRVSKGQWFTTSHQSSFSAHPVFNMSGELLGQNCSSPVGADAIHHSANLISDNWNELAAGLNLDRKRLIADAKPQQVSGKLPESMSEDALAKAKAASVQIGDVGAKPVFSGVIVPDGYVITCGHQDRLTGAKLTVLLADGRSANAVVLGANWLTDVSVLKITDEGVWPSAKLGYSSFLTPGRPVVAIGYPIIKDQKPMILETQAIAPTQTLQSRDAWYDEFWIECDKETVGETRGASGGGIFDTSGNVIGVLLGGAGNEIQNARAELFHKNWADLTASNLIEVIDPKLRLDVSPALKKLMADLNNRDPQP